MAIEKGIFSQETNFIAHVVPETNRTQSETAHLRNVIALGEKNCPMDCLRNLIKITAALHDAGKVSLEFQKYMEDIRDRGDNIYRQQIDHASAGGRIAEEIAGGALVGKMVATAVYSHHGLQDCIDMSTGKLLSEKRKEKDISFQIVKERFYQICDKKVLTQWFLGAHQDIQKIYKKIKETMGESKTEGKYGDIEFFLGMYERLLLSVLIDSDWSDSASFTDNIPLPERLSEEQTQEIWDDMIVNFENYMKITHGEQKSVLDEYRNEISDLCYQASQSEERLYRLTVPTGAGKTLSSLRFALHHAKKYKKRHIIYAAPYNSVLEQNAEDIRSAVGNEVHVLEHHCNVVHEDIQSEQIYKMLIENWDSAVIATTAVQMLNTLFSGQKSSIRRMYSLCNSVIIFDEVQAFPVYCTELFSLAVNFLVEFCNTTVVLCSATQPSLSERKENNIVKCGEMAGITGKYLEIFRRVEIEDKRNIVPGGMNIAQVTGFTLKAFEEYGSVLVIVNTKSAALELYESLKRRCEDERLLYHLSNNMCPQNRIDELSEIKKMLLERRKIICVSTQLVEAGVDFSFGCVIRSLAGLDNIVQAAGRCNRHKEMDRLGKVYIIEISKEVEKMEYLYEIKRAQEACIRLLDEFEQEPERFKRDLSSEEAVRKYYDLFYFGLDQEEMKYPIVIEGGIKTNLIELLGKNRLGQAQYGRCHRGQMPKLPLNQAFRTAGEKFEAISDDGKISVVVPYNNEAQKLITRLEKGNMTFSEQKSIFRKLQRFTVGISPWLRDKLKEALYSVGKSQILVLNSDYYDHKTGVKEIPKRAFLDF